MSLYFLYPVPVAFFPPASISSRAQILPSLHILNSYPRSHCVHHFLLPTFRPFSLLPYLSPHRWAVEWAKEGRRRRKWRLQVRCQLAKPQEQTIDAVGFNIIEVAIESREYGKTEGETQRSLREEGELKGMS